MEITKATIDKRRIDTDERLKAFIKDYKITSGTLNKYEVTKESIEQTSRG